MSETEDLCNAYRTACLAVDEAKRKLGGLVRTPGGDWTEEQEAQWQAVKAKVEARRALLEHLEDL